MVTGYSIESGIKTAEILEGIPLRPGYNTSSWVSLAACDGFLCAIVTKDHRFVSQ